MTPWVKRLIAANVLVYFVQLAVQPFTGLFAFIPALVFSRPWTVVTYMFLHDPRSLLHILFNMIVLFFFGPRVEARLGSNRFITLYFIAGISGAVLSFFLTPYSAIIGASAAVFGVETAFAKYWPRELIYIWGVIPIPAFLLIALTVGYSMWSGMNGSTSGVADFAHLGGIAGAFLYSALARPAPWRHPVPGQGHGAAQTGGDAGAQLAQGRPVHDPRAESRGGQPHPRQDQRAGDREPDRRRAGVPVELRPAGRPGAAGDLSRPRREREATFLLSLESKGKNPEVRSP